MGDFLKKIPIAVLLCLFFVFALLHKEKVLIETSTILYDKTQNFVDGRNHKNSNETCLDVKCKMKFKNCSCVEKRNPPYTTPRQSQHSSTTLNFHLNTIKLNEFIIKKLKSSLNKFNLNVKQCNKNRVNNWSFQCTVPCPSMPVFHAGQERQQILINCQKQSTAMMVKVKNVGTVQKIYDDSQCLNSYILHNCYDGNPVPNIVHYMWFSKHELNFYHFLSVISASKFLKPCLILFHGDHVPYGFYWDYLLHVVPNILHVFRQPPETVFGKKLAKLEHKADVGRIQTLQKYGGIYLDTDEIILKSLTPLRKYPFTLSHALDDNLSNGLILSEPNAAFLKLWFEEYKTYTKDQWAFHSTILPYKISKKHPHIIHVENKTFVRPNYTQLPLLFKLNFDWSKNYAIHLYIRFYKHQHDFNDVKYLNTTIGSVARHVLYGNKELCSL